MSEKMYPIPFKSLMNWVVTEYAMSGEIFGVHKAYKASGKSLPIFGERIETPFGPAAGGPFCCRRYPACAAVWPRLRGRVAPPLRRVKGAHETPHKPPLRSGWWRSSWTSLDPSSLRCGFAGSKADDDARRRHSALPAGARC